MPTETRPVAPYHNMRPVEKVSNQKSRPGTIPGRLKYDSLIRNQAITLLLIIVIGEVFADESIFNGQDGTDREFKNGSVGRRTL